MLRVGRIIQGHCLMPPKESTTSRKWTQVANLRGPVTTFGQHMRTLACSWDGRTI